MQAIILAVNWEFELRGILTVMIGTVVWMGSIYLILGTNVGARLGFMLTLTGLAGWIALMASVWWIYGIGLKGSVPEWHQVPGRTVIQEVDLLYQAGVLDDPIDVNADTDSVVAAQAVADQLDAQGWSRVDESAPEFGQAEASAGVFLEEEGALKPGEFKVTNVYEVDPPHESAFPKFGPNGEFDQLAFFHKPYYTLVEVAPFEALRAEPGRAPTAPQVDMSRQRQYVYMIRDLGSLREPSAYIAIGSTIVFLSMCFLLHRRDRFVAANLERKAIAAA
jgi:predicted transcriptional regulator